MRWILTSRRRVLLVAIGLLLLLDLGRSIYARMGYASPAEAWQEAPYTGIAWPPGADLPASAPLGKRIYMEKCALCHGPDGRGDGPAAPSMIPRPRDFTQGSYKYKSTAAGQPPTDDDLFNIVANGLSASAMPYFSDILTAEEISAVVDHIKGFSSVFDGPAPEPIVASDSVPSDAESVARGKILFTQKGCIGCHGDDLRSNMTLRDRKGYPVHSRDLTAPWTFRGGSEPEQIWLRLTTGLAPSPMPSHAETMTPNERWDVVNYLLSQSRVPPWETGGVLDGPGQAEELVKRGEYLTHIEMCGLCHTQVSTDMRYSGDDYYLAGGMGISVYPHGVFVSRNLTPDPETGLGNWTEKQIADAIRNGRSPDRALNLWGMPWMFLHGLSQDDALAIAGYLKTLPPVVNKIPPTLRYGVVETMIAKMLYSKSTPPIGNAKSLVYKVGNYGQTEPSMLPRDWPQRLLIGGQWLLLLVGLIAYVAAAPRERRWPRRLRGWIIGGLAVLGLLIVGMLGWVLYETPALSLMPPEQIGDAVLSSILQPDPALLESAEKVSLAERGRYLYTVTSCAFCHGNNGAGGSKISARTGFGTLWVSNISSDPTTGIGEWSNAEIARAIRSGISRDGGPLHWQGMVWDHLSNLAEEDMAALIVYLRTLPPVKNEIPAPSPPSPTDCEEYTFYLESSNQAGCE